MKVSLSHVDPEQVADALAIVIEEFRRFSQKGIGLINNCKTSLVEVTSPAGANTEFTVTHRLGVIPFMHIWNVDAGATVYDSRRVDWTTDEIYLKCTGSSVAVRCTVLGR